MLLICSQFLDTQFPACKLLAPIIEYCDNNAGIYILVDGYIQTWLVACHAEIKEIE